MRPSASLLTSLLTLLLATACSASVTRSEPPQEAIVSPPDEAGNRYIGVEGGRSSTTAGMRAQWRRAARRTCDGDFLELTHGGSEQLRSGVVVGRRHEGWVRCVLEPDDPEAELAKRGGGNGKDDPGKGSNEPPEKDAAKADGAGKDTGARRPPRARRRRRLPRLGL